jgi:hypothetical protein
MGLFIRTIGLDRAKVKIGMANLVYKFKTIAVPAQNRRSLRNGEENRSHCHSNRPQKSRVLRPKSAHCQSATVTAALIEASIFTSLAGE